MIPTFPPLAPQTVRGEEEVVPGQEEGGRRKGEDRGGKEEGKKGVGKDEEDRKGGKKRCEGGEGRREGGELLVRGPILSLQVL